MCVRAFYKKILRNLCVCIAEVYKFIFMKFRLLYMSLYMTHIRARVHVWDTSDIFLILYFYLLFLFYERYRSKELQT